MTRWNPLRSTATVLPPLLAVSLLAVFLLAMSAGSKALASGPPPSPNPNAQGGGPSQNTLIFDENDGATA